MQFRVTPEESATISEWYWNLQQEAVQRGCFLPEIQPPDVADGEIAAERRFVQSEGSRNDEADVVF